MLTDRLYSSNHKTDVLENISLDKWLGVKYCSTETSIIEIR